MATTVSEMATTVPNGNDHLRKGKLLRRVAEQLLSLANEGELYIEQKYM